tara:strand:- start:323 stop:526 length:204 start_codon:yes stop_codon:yes gene_type:complete
MQCPNCKTELKRGLKKVVSVEARSIYTIRYIRCKVCSHKYKTIEFKYPNELPIYKISKILKDSNLIA